MRIIPRAEWGARHANGAGSAPLPARGLRLHHSTTIAPDLVPPFDDDYAAVRTLERIGQERFGRGISYTFAVTPVGLIFEGHSVDRLGAHTKGYNAVERAVVLVGNYQSVHPTGPQLDAVAWLLVHGWLSGWWPATDLTGGHRDTSATACPGDAAYAAIPEINRRAKALADALFTPVPQSEEDTMVIGRENHHWRMLICPDGTVLAGPSAGGARTPDIVLPGPAWDRLVKHLGKRLVRLG